MPLIQRIASAPFHVPLKRPLTWGRGHRLAALRHVLIRVELDDGAVGFAEATPRPSIYGETQASIQHILDEELSPRLLGKPVSDFDSVAEISAGLAHIKGNNTAKGALDMALHSALAISRQQSLRDYLGCPRDKIRLSAIVSTGTPAAVQADVSELYAAGVRCFKVKIGRDISGETATLQALVADFPAARFYVDANETLPLDTAAETLDRLREMGVLYCEEPLPTHLLRDRGALRQATAMPTIADDSAFTPRELERELAFDTFDILNIKPARTGFSLSLRMLRLAAAQGKSAMVGSQASSLLGCLYAALLAGRAEVDCESECSFYLKTADNLAGAPQIVDGCLPLDGVESALRGLCGRLYSASTSRH